MTNIRLKKGENHPQNKEDIPEKGSEQPKDEPFPDPAEDELTRKRKMILTGITAGVAVAGASAAALLFFGPYSPFGVKQPEKPVNLPKESKVTAPQPAAEAPPVPESPEHAASPIIRAAPIPQSAKEPSPKVTNAPKAKDGIASIPKSTAKATKPTEKAPIENMPMPVENDTIESSGPTSYIYNIQDGGPVILIPANKKVTVSRDPSFKSIYLNGTPAADGKYRISIPPPGEVYWKEEGKPAHKLTIIPPIPSGLRADIPPKMKLSDRLVWSATGKVSFYRIEVSNDADFNNKTRTFSTVNTSLPAQAIGQGKWFIKISALNLQSGVWDSTKSIPLSIEDTQAEHKEPPKIENKPEVKEVEKAETPEPTEPVKPIEPTIEQPSSESKPDANSSTPQVEE